MSVKCSCGQEDISASPDAVWIYENVSHSKLRCVNIVENGGTFIKGMVNYVKPYHVEKFDHPLNVPEGTMFSNVPETDPKVIRQQMLDSIKSSQKYIESAVDNKTNIYANRWDGGQFKEEDYRFDPMVYMEPETKCPEAKYTEDDMNSQFRKAYDLGYADGEKQAKKDIRSSSRPYMRSFDHDFEMTKAHVEKSEEYWADGIDPDEP